MADLESKCERLEHENRMLSLRVNHQSDDKLTSLEDDLLETQRQRSAFETQLSMTQLRLSSIEQENENLKIELETIKQGSALSTRVEHVNN